MANPEHLAILKQGVEVWNRWRDSGARPDLIQANLGGADLAGMMLGKADLGGADLRGANLTRADLSGSDLIACNLREANLHRATLVRSMVDRADLRRADLRSSLLGGTFLTGSDLRQANLSEALIGGADFTDADLSGVNLSLAVAPQTNFAQTRLDGADLSGSLLVGTLFIGVDLSSVRGLDSCRHLGPSTIDMRTFSRSGQLPISFLRGCGMPETLIEYLPSILGGPIQFYSCFLSYSTRDQEFAERLHADLQASGVRCWFAPHDIRGGKKLHEQIDEAIRVYNRLLVILSEHSMDSEWVRSEIAKARKKEAREARRVLFPIRLCTFEALRDWESFDADTGKDSAREIREYFIPDFSNWKEHGSYTAAFQRLLRDLRAEN